MLLSNNPDMLYQENHAMTTKPGQPTIAFDEETYVSEEEYEVVDDVVEEYTVVEEEEIVEEEIIEEEIIEEITDDEEGDGDDEDGWNSDYDSDPPPDPNDDADSVATEDIDGFMLNLQTNDTRVSCISMGDFLLDYGSRYNVEEFDSDEDEEAAKFPPPGGDLDVSARSDVSDLGASGRFYKSHFGETTALDGSKRRPGAASADSDSDADMRPAKPESMYNIQHRTPLGMMSPMKNDLSPQKKKKTGIAIGAQANKAGGRVRPVAGGRITRMKASTDPSALSATPDDSSVDTATRRSRKIRYIPNAGKAMQRRVGGGGTVASKRGPRKSTSNLMAITEAAEEMQNSGPLNNDDLPPSGKNATTSSGDDGSDNDSEPGKLTKKVAKKASTKIGSFGPKAPPSPVPSKPTTKIGSFGPKAPPSPKTKIGSFGPKPGKALPIAKRMPDPPPSGPTKVVSKAADSSGPTKVLSKAADPPTSTSPPAPKTPSSDSKKKKSKRDSRSNSPGSGRKTRTSSRSKSPSRSKRGSRSKSPTRSKEDGNENSAKAPRRKLKSKKGSPTRGIQASKSMDELFPSPKASSKNRKHVRSASPSRYLEDDDDAPKSKPVKVRRDPLSSSSSSQKKPLRKTKDLLSSSSHGEKVSSNRRRQLKYMRSDSSRSLDASTVQQTTTKPGDNAPTERRLVRKHSRKREKKSSKNKGGEEPKRAPRFEDLLSKMSPK